MLEVYKDELGMTAGFFTILQLLSPLILCWDFIKKKSTEGVDVMPFIGGLVLSIAFTQFAILINDKVMLYVNVFAIALGTTYLLLYYFYTHNKAKLWSVFGKYIAFVAVLIGYAQNESPELVTFRFGMITTFVLFALISAPIFKISEIVQTKNTDHLPMPLIISGSAVATCWLLYGLANHDNFTVVQNLVVLSLQVFQIGLFCYVKLCSGKQKSKSSVSVKSKKTN